MILLVEDNDSILDGLTTLFINKGYSVKTSQNVKDTIDILEKEVISLIILDITLPDGNGFSLYEDYIKTRNIPLIFLTARDTEEDIVKGLNLGAEDYITKPFSSLELLARVERILKRVKKDNKVKIKDIIYDIDKMEVIKDGKRVLLSSMEHKIFNLLVANKGNIITRDIILEKIWEWTGNDVDDHTLTVYIKRIKDKTGDVIKTIKKVGYKIDE